MTVLVDLGNTALKWADLDTPEVPKTIIHGGAHDYSQQLKNSLNGQECSHAVGCSVASYDLTKTTERIFKSFGCSFHWLKSQEVFQGAFELYNGYKNPQQLGSDRWHAAIGACSFLPNTALLVVHVGTATTVDCVIPEDIGRLRFVGGRIAPGVVLMRDSLVSGTATLPKAEGSYKNIPNSTMDAIITGIIDSQLGLIERGMKSMQQDGFTPTLVLAGGAASMFSPYLKQEFPQMIQKHNLVLRGLQLRVQKNSQT